MFINNLINTCLKKDMSIPAAIAIVFIFFRSGITYIAEIDLYHFGLFIVDYQTFYLFFERWLSILILPIVLILLLIGLFRNRFTFLGIAILSVYSIWEFIYYNFLLDQNVFFKENDYIPQTFILVIYFLTKLWKAFKEQRAQKEN